MDSFGFDKLNSDNVSETYELVMNYVVLYGVEVLAAILMLVVGWWVAGRMQSVTKSALSRVKNADATLTGFLSGTVRYVIIAVTIVAVLNQFGVETTSLIAVLGAAGLAIGLALQGTLANVAAGVMLLFFRPFRVGHFVNVGGHMGTVKNLGLFTTELSTIDSVQIIIPNGDIWGTSITNYSVYKKRRFDLTVGVAYDASLDDTIKVLKKIVSKDKRVLDDPAEPVYFVESLGDSAVNITARFWVASSDYWQTRWDFTKAVKEELDKAGIEIPFPQRTVHMVTPKNSEPVAANETSSKTAKKKASK